jgi:hypothetical protein
VAVRIALVGRYMSGRTWAAGYLRDAHNFKKESIGEVLDEFVKRLYYYGDHKRVRWETRLRLYDAWYNIDPEIWVGHMERRLRTTTRDVVVDDLRYSNEVAVLKSLGFTVVRVVAPEGRRHKRIEAYKWVDKPGLLAVHEEYNRDFDSSVGVDFSIYNDSKEDSRKSLDDLVGRLRKLDIDHAGR